MTDIVISDITRRAVYTGSAGTGPYSFTFELLDEGDIAVYVNDTLQTITTDYTVSLDPDGTGSVTLVSAASASDTVVIVGNKGIARSTDFVTGGDLLASSLNQELDAQTIFAQQNAEAVSRAIKIPVQSSLSIDTTLPVPQANYILGWNDSGDAILNLQEIGSYQGTDATTTTANYNERDLVKETGTNNVYICIANSSTGTLLTNTTYWSKIIDAEAAGDAQTAAEAAQAAAETAEDNAQDWAVKTDGIVESTDYSSKAWSIGGTGVTSTSGKGAAKQWATTTGAAVDTSEYSAKEYAIGDLTATGGSAKAWAIDSSSPDGGSEKSAKTLAGEAATSASNASTSATNASTAQGYAEEWANKAEDSLISVAAGGDGSTEYSALHWAAKARASKEAIDAYYLGAQASDPSTDLNGDALTQGDWYFNTTDQRIRIYSASGWIYGALDPTGYVTLTGNQTLTNKTIDSVSNDVGADHVHLKVRNTTGSTITKGTLLKATGYDTGHDCITVAAIGTLGDVAIGILEADLANNTNGAVTNTGVIEGQVTDSFSLGDILYSDGAGSLVNTKPSTAYQTIGYVLRSHASAGVIFVEFTEPNDPYDADTLKADTADTLTAPFRGAVTTDNDLSFDMNVTNNFKCTPTANGTLTFTNITSGQSGNIFLVNSGGYAISAAATTYISAADLSAISTAGSYFLSYFSDGTNVMVSASAAVTSAGA